MEKVSALMDGELGDSEARGQIARLKLDADLKYGWESYHLIGDMLRGDAALSADFNRRMAGRLAQEATVLAPQRRLLTPTRKFYTYAVSAAASVAGFALVGWVVMSTGSTPRTELAQAPVAAPALATAPATAAATAPAPDAVAAAPQTEVSVPSEGQSNEYLLAHQGFSPSTAIQGVAPYIRTISDISQVAPVPR